MGRGLGEKVEREETERWTGFREIEERDPYPDGRQSQLQRRDLNAGRSHAFTEPPSRDRRIGEGAGQRPTDEER